MDRRRRLDAVRNLSAESPNGHARRCAARGEAIFRRGSEHDGLVRADGAKNGEGLVIRLSMMMVMMAVNGAAVAAANMADQAHRSRVDWIDLITYRSNLDDVVVILVVF